MAEMIVSIGTPSEMTVGVDGVPISAIDGVTATGTALMTAASAAAARTAIGITATQLMTGSITNVPKSVAVDVAGLVTDFNNLLTVLAARGVITSA